MIPAAALFATLYLALLLLMFRWRYAFVVLVATLLLTQNLATMIVLRLGWVSIEDGQILLLLKEVALVIGLAVGMGGLIARAAIRQRLRLNPTERLILVFFAFLLIPFVLSQAPSFSARLAGLRSLVLLPGLYLVGRWLRFPRRDRGRLFRLLVVVAVALASFGLIETYLLPESFWLSIGHEEYYLMKRGRPIEGTLYGNMRFWIDGQPIRRVASLTGDPLISSYPMAFVLTLLVAFTTTTRRIRYSNLLLASLLLVATALTLSRGALVAIALATGALLLSARRAWVFTSLTVMSFIGAVAASLLLNDFLLGITYGKGHLEQLRLGLELGLRHPLGLGTGTAGGVAAAIVTAAGPSTVRIGADSFIGSTAIQIGIVGTLLMLWVMIAIARELFVQGVWAQRTGDRAAWLYFGTAAFLAGLLVVSTVNEAGYGYIASGLSFLFAGVLSGHADTYRAPAPETQRPLPGPLTSPTHRVGN